MLNRATAVATAFSAVAVLTLSSCGSTENQTSEQVTVPEGEPIVIGTICSCTGAQASSAALASPILQAWADSVNDNGGLNGHAVELIIKDDGGVPARALQAAKELVEEEGVVAIVGEVGSNDIAFADYLEDKGVPVVGGYVSNAPFRTHANFFPQGTNSPVGTVGVLNQVANNGLDEFGVLNCSESPVCAQFVPLAEVAADLVDVGFNALTVDSTAPNYTAPCLRMRENGVDALYAAVNAQAIARIAEGCRSAGYSPTFVGNLTAVGQATFGEAPFEGSLWASSNAPFLDTSIPGIKAFHDALERYAPDVLDSEQFTQVASSAWLGGKLFEAASEAAGGFSPDTTSAEVMEGLYALKDETLDGTAPPINFVEGEGAFPTCYFTSAVTDGELRATNDGKPSCLEDEQVATLKKLLAAAG